MGAMEAGSKVKRPTSNAISNGEATMPILGGLRYGEEAGQYDGEAKPAASSKAMAAANSMVGYGDGDPRSQ